MLYERRSFTLPASAGHRSTCDSYGHTFADIRGNCLRCGDHVPTLEEQGYTTPQLGIARQTASQETV